MGKKRVLLPAEEVDVTAQKYEFQQIKGPFFLHNSMPFMYLYHGFWFHVVSLCAAAPHLTGFMLKLFVKLLEAPVIGPLIADHLKKQNQINEVPISFVFISCFYDVNTVQLCLLMCFDCLIYFLVAPCFMDSSTV